MQHRFSESVLQIYDFNFKGQRKDLERGWFQLSWLHPMVKEYGVSAKWLLTGLGRMFEEQK